MRPTSASPGFGFGKIICRGKEDEAIVEITAVAQLAPLTISSKKVPQGVTWNGRDVTAELIALGKGWTRERVERLGFAHTRFHERPSLRLPRSGIVRECPSRSNPPVARVSLLLISRYPALSNR